MGVLAHFPVPHLAHPLPDTTHPEMHCQAQAEEVEPAVNAALGGGELEHAAHIVIPEVLA